MYVLTLPCECVLVCSFGVCCRHSVFMHISRLSDSLWIITPLMHTESSAFRFIIKFRTLFCQCNLAQLFVWFIYSYFGWQFVTWFYSLTDTSFWWASRTVMRSCSIGSWPQTSSDSCPLCTHLPLALHASSTAWRSGDLGKRLQNVPLLICFYSEILSPSALLVNRHIHPPARLSLSPGRSWCTFVECPAL